MQPQSERPARTARTFTETARRIEPRLAAEVTATGKIGAYLAGSADYISTYRNLHLAVLEIGFNAVGPDGLPLVASMPLETHKPALDQILSDGQQAGELRDFDVQVMAGLVRSAVAHTMVLARRANPALDVHAYTRELAITFDLATRASAS